MDNGHTLTISSVKWSVSSSRRYDFWCSTLHIFFTNQLEAADNRYDESRSTDINMGERTTQRAKLKSHQICNCKRCDVNLMSPGRCSSLLIFLPTSCSLLITDSVAWLPLLQEIALKYECVSDSMLPSSMNSTDQIELHANMNETVDKGIYTNPETIRAQTCNEREMEERKLSGLWFFFPSENWPLSSNCIVLLLYSPV